MRAVRWAVAVLAVAAATLTGCSSNHKNSSTISVFDVKPGECFDTPSTVKAQLSDLTKVTCTTAHTQEAYAIVAYSASGSVPSAAPSSSAAPSVSDDAFPGADVLTDFAKGACAQRFRGYVGIDYLDSSLYFTYLLPSARSWEQNDDRSVLCFITTTGGTLDSSVRNSKR